MRRAPGDEARPSRSDSGVHVDQALGRSGFLRGLAIGALVGGVIAGSVVRDRRRKGHSSVPRGASDDGTEGLAR